MIKIYSPSYKRPDLCISHKIIPNLKYVIAEKEYNNYIKFIDKKNIEAIPDQFQGNNVIVRNYILDKFNDSEIVMIDDDVIEIKYISGYVSQKSNEKKIYDMIDNLLSIMYDVGAYLGGINLIHEPRAYRENTPFSFQTAVLGPFNIHIKHDLRYDIKVNLKADYDMFLQQIMKYKYVVRDNRFSYNCRMQDLKGGCSDFRTFEKEMIQLKLFANKWGNIVKIDKQSKSIDINPIIKL